MKIGNNVSFPLNLAAIAHKEIIVAESLMLPYNDLELNKHVAALACDVASNTDFIYPDYDNIKVYILVDVWDSESFKPSLLIEVQPPRYYEGEKADILATADRDTFGTDFSDYTIWQDIFANAEYFHQQRGCAMGENIGTYPIEFEDEELKSFMWFLVQHCHIVAVGGEYR